MKAIIEKKSKKVICLNTGKIYYSCAEAERVCKCCSGTVSDVCNGKRCASGIDESTGERLMWMFYDDYINSTEEEIQERIDYLLLHQKRKGIACIETGEVFFNMMDVVKKYQASVSGIRDSCRNQKYASGNHPETGERLHWMYYTDYLKQKEAMQDCG